MGSITYVFVQNKEKYKYFFFLDEKIKYLIWIYVSYVGLDERVHVS